MSILPQLTGDRGKSMWFEILVVVALAILAMLNLRIQTQLEEINMDVLSISTER